MNTCRECENEINEGTEICPHCGADLTLLAAADRAVNGRTPLRTTLVRWIPLLAVLVGALWIFFWFTSKH